MLIPVQALYDASCRPSEKAPLVQIAVSTSKYIEFKPEKWRNTDWVVNATSSAQVYM